MSAKPWRNGRGYVGAGPIIERLLEVYEAKNDLQLAKTLGTGASTIATWRARDIVPKRVVMEASLTKGVSLDWLMEGVGGKTPSATPTLLSPRLDAKLRIIELGEEIGYGQLMSEASRFWGRKLSNKGYPGGEFAVGPCVSLTVPCSCTKGCDWCCGCGWLTKKVAAIKAQSEQ